MLNIKYEYFYQIKFKLESPQSRSVPYIGNLSYPIPLMDI